MQSRRDAKSGGIEAGARDHAHVLETTGEEHGGKIVLGRHEGFQLIPSAQGNDFLNSGEGGFLQGGERHRRQELRRGGGGGAFPVDMIDQIAAAAGSPGAAGGRHADSAEAVDQHAGLTGFIIKADPAFDQLLIEVQDFGRNPGHGTGGSQEKDPGETHRKLHFGPAVLHGFGSGRKDLECPVQQHGMQGVFSGAVGDVVGQGHASGRMPAAG